MFVGEYSSTHENNPVALLVVGLAVSWDAFVPWFGPLVGGGAGVVIVGGW